MPARGRLATDEQRAALLTRFKTQLQGAQKAIRERYLATPDAARLLAERSRLIDELL